MINQAHVLITELKRASLQCGPLLPGPASIHDAPGRVPVNALEDMRYLMHHDVRQKSLAGCLKLHPVPEYPDVNAFKWERVSPRAGQKSGWTVVNEFNDDSRGFRCRGADLAQIQRNADSREHLRSESLSLRPDDEWNDDVIAQVHRSCRSVPDLPCAPAAISNAAAVTAVIFIIPCRSPQRRGLEEKNWQGRVIFFKYGERTYNSVN